MTDYSIKNSITNYQKKILIRAGFNPLKHYQPTDFFRFNLVGDNLGNLLFAYGAMNALWTENAIIEHIYDKQSFSEKEIEYINSNYDAFVMPMADAFRTSYIPTLKTYTSLIRQLKIPVVVVGIGFRTTYEPQFDINPELDTVVKEFTKTVLDHSSALGLRGEITGEYLKRLGFKEERDYIPIGCPSLYTYGNNLHLRKELDKFSIRQGKLVFNVNTRAQSLFGKYASEINSFILNTINEVPDHYLIQQLTTEFKSLYFGGIYSKRIEKTSVLPPEEMLSMLKNDRVKCFLDVPSWIGFCKDADLFVGNRFHGAVAAILAGTPHVFLPFDGRTRELSEFHHFTMIQPDMIKKNTNLFDYYDELDFRSFGKKHNENFSNYIDFLRRNNLHHIFESKDFYRAGESPMEKNMIIANRNVSAIESLSFMQKTRRIVSCFPFILHRIKLYVHSK